MTSQWGQQQQRQWQWQLQQWWVNEENNNNNNNNGDVGEEEDEEEGNADANDPDVYNCELEEFGQNSIDDADANVEVEEENNAKGVAPTIIVQFWYDKVSEWIKFVNDQSKGIVDKLSEILSINEMMKLFKGCHNQTHIMKQKPIKKWFKFWACSCPVIGFVYGFVPSGRMEKERIFDIVMGIAKSSQGMDK